MLLITVPAKKIRQHKCSPNELIHISGSKYVITYNSIDYCFISRGTYFVQIQLLNETKC